MHPSRKEPPKVKEFELYFPLRYNDGTPIDPAILERIGDRLMETFGGYTFNPQAHKGVWKMGDVTYRDEIVIYRVLTGKVRLARSFFKKLKEELKEDLEQEEILIVSKEAEIH
jgi:hypothetical protein